MRTLVTGHRGMVGQEVIRALTHAGHEVVGYDLVDGDDVLDYAHLLASATGCHAVIHLAALDEEPDEHSELSPRSIGSAPDIATTNIAGTRNVLAAAAQVGMKRVVFLSSVDVLGCFMGQGNPDYLPIDDYHPTNPKGPYALSKLAAEDLCEEFTKTTGIPTICLRPPGVFDAATYAFIRTARTENPEFEWSPFWEYGAFIDVADLAQAVLHALTEEIFGHHRLLVCAGDISSSSEDSLQLAKRLLPDVPVHHPGQYKRHPFAALVDSSNATALLRWVPQHSWRPTNAQ
ncbi:MAG TPA: NAD(P)-dependent oxidoreductase [Actinomycetes bacterium]|nr:NAD(P)-dependent oxidoreductase [Actinomycetes bacterium]